MCYGIIFVFLAHQHKAEGINIVIENRHGCNGFLFGDHWSVMEWDHISPIEDHGEMME